MSEIPPEGDEYNARRQEDLHAAIANKAALERRFAQLIRDNASLDQIGQLIDAMAVNEREIPHISKDLAVSVQGRNLNIFLDRMKDELQVHEGNNTALLAGVNNSLNLLNTTVAEVLQTARQALTVAKAGAARLGKLEKDTALLKQGQSDYNKRLDEVIRRLETDEQRLDRKRERLDEAERQIAELRQIIAERQAQRPIEYEQLADAIVERLKARDDGGD